MTEREYLRELDKLLIMIVDTGIFRLPVNLRDEVQKCLGYRRDFKRTEGDPTTNRAAMLDDTINQYIAQRDQNKN